MQPSPTASGRLSAQRATNSASMPHDVTQNLAPASLVHQLAGLCPSGDVMAYSCCTVSFTWEARTALQLCGDVKYKWATDIMGAACDSKHFGEPTAEGLCCAAPEQSS